MTIPAKKGSSSMDKGVNSPLLLIEIFIAHLIYHIEVIFPFHNAGVPLPIRFMVHNRSEKRRDLERVFL
jgi:hypothetical protein